MGKWIEPAMDARYLCDDGNVRTWGELTRDGVSAARGGNH